jgi:hypothetical protein
MKQLSMYSTRNFVYIAEDSFKKAINNGKKLRSQPKITFFSMQILKYFKNKMMAAKNTYTTRGIIFKQ